MANNFFNPFPQQQNFMQQMPQNAPSSNITVQLVQGENGARLYPVAPKKRIYEERKLWEIERAKGVLVRHILTDTIKNVLPESPHKNFAYPNYTNLFYKILFGKTAKELKAEFKIQKAESVREFLTKDELAEVENLERLTAGLINLGWGYEQIKNFLNENVYKEITNLKGGN